MRPKLAVTAFYLYQQTMLTINAKLQTDIADYHNMGSEKFKNVRRLLSLINYRVRKEIQFS